MISSDWKEILKPTAAVGCISLILAGVAQPVYYLLAKTGIFSYTLFPFLFGALYGVLLGVGNFFVMALSLTRLTSSGADAAEAKKKAQASYTARSLAVIALMVVGCVIPFFSAVAVILSVAITQLGIVLYALVARSAEMKKIKNVSSVPPAPDGMEEEKTDTVPEEAQTGEEKHSPEETSAE